MDSANPIYVCYLGLGPLPGPPKPATGVPNLTTRAFGLTARTSTPTDRAFCSIARASDLDLRAQCLCLREQIIMGSPEFIIVIILTLYIGPQLLNIMFAALQILL